jgi:hypothetical protein
MTSTYGHVFTYDVWICFQGLLLGRMCQVYMLLTWQLLLQMHLLCQVHLSLTLGADLLQG